MNYLSSQLLGTCSWQKCYVLLAIISSLGKSSEVQSATLALIYMRMLSDTTCAGMLAAKAPAKHGPLLECANATAICMRAYQPSAWSSG